MPWPGCFHPLYCRGFKPDSACDKATGESVRRGLHSVVSDRGSEEPRMLRSAEDLAKMGSQGAGKLANEDAKSRRAGARGAKSIQSALARNRS